MGGDSPNLFCTQHYVCIWAIITLILHYLLLRISVVFFSEVIPHTDLIIPCTLALPFLIHALFRYVRDKLLPPTFTTSQFTFLLSFLIHGAVQGVAEFGVLGCYWHSALLCCVACYGKVVDHGDSLHIVKSTAICVGQSVVVLLSRMVWAPVDSISDGVHLKLEAYAFACVLATVLYVADNDDDPVAVAIVYLFVKIGVWCSSLIDSITGLLNSVLSL